MTVKEKLINMLVEYGMFEEQAKEVIELAIPKLNELADDYVITYDAPDDQYPTGVYTVWFISIKKIALQWIDENKPEAWYREMFL